MVKTCSKCKIDKPNSDFRMRKGKTANQASYLNSACRECEKEAKKEYVLKNHLKCRQSEKKWRLNNKDKVKAQQKRSYDKNKIKRIQCALNHYYNNKQNKISLVKKWREINKEKVKTYRKVYEEKYYSTLIEKRKIRYKLQRDLLRSRYLKSLLARSGFPTNQITDEIIEIKKLLIKTKREIKNHENKNHNPARCNPSTK